MQFKVKRWWTGQHGEVKLHNSRRSIEDMENRVYLGSPNLHNSLPAAREGNVFTGVCHSVHNRPHGYSVTDHPCNGTVGMHSTECFLINARKWSLRKLCFCRCLSMGSIQGGLCPGGSLSGGTSLPRGVYIRERGVSVQGVSIWGRGSLSMGISVWGRLCPGVLCQGEPLMVTSRQYTSYWNAF